MADSTVGLTFLLKADPSQASAAIKQIRQTIGSEMTAIKGGGAGQKSTYELLQSVVIRDRDR
jgi:hypothetical protein